MDEPIFEMINKLQKRNHFQFHSRLRFVASSYLFHLILRLGLLLISRPWFYSLLIFYLLIKWQLCLDLISLETWPVELYFERVYCTVQGLDWRHKTPALHDAPSQQQQPHPFHAWLKTGHKSQNLVKKIIFLELEIKSKRFWSTHFVKCRSTCLIKAHSIWCILPIHILMKR